MTDGISTLYTRVGTFGHYPARVGAETDFVEQVREQHARPFATAHETVALLNVGRAG